MGKIKQGILGGFSGKVAGVIGSSWKGIATIRSRPLSVANPKTTKQVAQRTKFSLITKMASLLLGGVIKPLWDRFAVQQSGYNAFVSKNKAYFNADGSKNRGTLIIADGKMAAVPFELTEYNNVTGTAVLTWDDALKGPAERLDDIVFVEVDFEDEFLPAAVSGDSCIRGDGSDDFFIGKGMEDGASANIYLAMMRADGTVTTKTSHILFDV